MAPEMPPPPPPPTSRSSASASREAAVAASATDHQLQSKAYLSPSDASIDESVKSAQAGKDVSSDLLFCLSQCCQLGFEFQLKNLNYSGVRLIYIHI